MSYKEQRIRVYTPGGPVVEVTCPQHLEAAILDYSIEPWHLVGWGIMEASTPIQVNNQLSHPTGRADFAYILEMESMIDLPLDIVRRGERLWVIGSRVFVELPDWDPARAERPDEPQMQIVTEGP